jgi:hypothetical protein
MGGDTYHSDMIPIPAAPAPVWFGTGSTDVDSSVLTGWLPQAVQSSPVVVAASLVKPHSQTVNLTKTTHLGIRLLDLGLASTPDYFLPTFFWLGYCPCRKELDPHKQEK